MLAFDGAANVRKIEKAKPDALDDWSRRRAASLTTAGDLARQQAKRDQGPDTAAGQAAGHGIMTPGVPRIGVGERIPTPSPLPLPDGANPGGPSGLGMLRRLATNPTAEEAMLCSFQGLNQ